MKSFALKKRYWEEQVRGFLPTRGLVYHHPLSESLGVLPTGQTVAQSGTWTYGTVSGVPCATKANGTASILLEQDDTIPTGSAVRTTSIWIMRLYANAISIFGYGNNNNSANRWRYYNSSNGVVPPPSSAFVYAAAADVWHHYATVYDGTDVVNYVDGVMEDTQTNTGVDTTAISSSYPLFIGVDAWQYGFRAASARIYNRVLSQDEITALAHEFTPTA